MSSQIRHYVHYVISFYILFGGLLFSGILTKGMNLNMVRMHFLITLLVIIHWLTNNGNCVLSEMDYDTDDDANGYIAHILSVFGINGTKEQLKIAGWLGGIIPCLISLYIIKYNHENLFPKNFGLNF